MPYRVDEPEEDSPELLDPGPSASIGPTVVSLDSDVYLCKSLFFRLRKRRINNVKAPYGSERSDSPAAASSIELNAFDGAGDKPESTAHTFPFPSAVEQQKGRIYGGLSQEPENRASSAPAPEIDAGSASKDRNKTPESDAPSTPERPSRSLKQKGKEIAGQTSEAIAEPSASTPPMNDDESGRAKKPKKGTPKAKTSYDPEKHKIRYLFKKTTKKRTVYVHRKEPRDEPCSACVDREASGKGNGGCHNHDDESSSRCFDCHKGGSKCSSVPLVLQPVGYALYKRSIARDPAIEPDYQEVCFACFPALNAG